jgi:hypothetical protein
MIFERYFEVVAERLHAVMAVANPFASQLAYQVRILFEAEGDNPTSDTFSRFKHGHVPILECVGSC